MSVTTTTTVDLSDYAIVADAYHAIHADLLAEGAWDCDLTVDAVRRLYQCERDTACAIVAAMSTFGFVRIIRSTKRVIALGVN